MLTCLQLQASCLVAPLVPIDSPGKRSEWVGAVMKLPGRLAIDRLVQCTLNKLGASICVDIYNVAAHRERQ